MYQGSKIKNFTLNYAWIHFFFMILYSLYILWHTILIYLVVYRTKDNLLQRVMILADELLKYFPIILSLLLSLEYGFNETRSLLSCLSTIISKYITYLIIVLCALHLKIFFCSIIGCFHQEELNLIWIYINTSQIFSQ